MLITHRLLLSNLITSHFCIVHFKQIHNYYKHIQYKCGIDIEKNEERLKLNFNGSLAFSCTFAGHMVIYYQR